MILVVRSFVCVSLFPPLRSYCIFVTNNAYNQPNRNSNIVIYIVGGGGEGRGVVFFRGFNFWFGIIRGVCQSSSDMF